MEHTVTTKKWYVVTGTAGATVTSPDGSKTFCTIPEGGQGTFYATTSKVVTSDDSVEVVETTFNSAPVKLRLLGLLGGGVSTGLPAGYLQAEFLENDSFGAFMTLPISRPTSGNKIEIDVELYPIKGSEPASCDGNAREISYGWWSPNYMVTAPGVARAFGSFPPNEWASYKVTVEACKISLLAHNGGPWTFDMSNETTLNTHYLWKGSSSNERMIIARRKKHSYKFNGKYLYDLVPAIDEQGTPCMFDKVSKSAFYNSGTGQFVVGMTLSQARKLGQLPATGGTLTVSLPSNYAEDEGVVNALATAQENGWKITIQTYEAEASAASTFALRRVWVRKTQNKQGTYVDTDGFRWQVDWCVDVVGSSPEAEGYEPFRSVDVAVNYWNLQPWVDPEQDEILTNTNEQ